MTDTNALGPWECFQDASYYDMWCVRRVHDRTFGQGFHLVQGEEAAGLRDLLNTRATDEHPTANEVGEARLGDLRDKAENWQNRAERAEQALAERDAEIVRLKAIAWNWLSYDQLLRQYSGPMERLGAGDWDLADTTYDKCVKATVAALGGNDANNTGENHD